MAAGGGRKKKYQGGSSSILSVEKIEDGGSYSFIGPRRWNMEGVLRSSEPEDRTPPIFEEPPYV